MSNGPESDQAPPQRLANALDGLGRAVRHIADVRSGADLLLEALGSGAHIKGRETGTKKASDAIQKAADVMRKALDDLRATGIVLVSDNSLSTRNRSLCYLIVNAFRQYIIHFVGVCFHKKGN